MKNIKSIVSVSLVFCLLAMASGCKSSNALVLALEGAVDAASVAISVVTAGDPQAATALSYAQNISQAASQAITELGTSDTTALKIEKIVADFVAVPAPILKPGTQQIIIASVNAITNAVELFLQQLKGTQAAVAATAHTVGGQRQAAAVMAKLTFSDRSMLSTIQGKAKQNVKLAQAKK